ncbi:AraC-like DNA-binding protein [Paraburkholderia silvatlantica]|uniref:AraC-like DNA-binding protein n=2 Tax=Paraburkholderia silvatlantica TaxID=321895 RepID=A0A2V4U707_9BURK|nr:AraC-like DNA-binding protein [Paraburkholderia silvatlantica]
MLRVSSMISTRFEGRGAWALRFPAYRHIKFGSVLSGRFYLWLEGEAPLALDKGDFYLLTGGQPFCSASDLTRTLEDGVAIIRGSRGEDGIARYDGAGEGIPVSLVSGRFTFEDDAPELLLHHLPPLIHLRAAEIGTSALAVILDLLRLESGGMHTGAAVARSSLAALALVYILRAWLESTPQSTGWLGALSDPKIGKALSAMHAEPGKRWTLECLSAHVAMSRTAFANRFRDLVGQPPLDYLQHWRMALARTMLRNTDVPLTELAARMGYLSDTAFSSAFKRNTGTSPGQFRAAGTNRKSRSH